MGREIPEAAEAGRLGRCRVEENSGQAVLQCRVRGDRGEGGVDRDKYLVVRTPLEYISVRTGGGNLTQLRPNREKANSVEPG